MENVPAEEFLREGEQNFNSDDNPAFSPDRLRNVDNWVEMREKVGEWVSEFQSACDAYLKECGIEFEINGQEGWTNESLEGLPIEVPIVCMRDTYRTTQLSKAIVDSAHEIGGVYEIQKPLITDMGTGTGILAYIADKIFREAGMEPDIVAVEIVPETAELARNLLDRVGANHIPVILGDARKPSEIEAINRGIDVVISENLSAGLVEEHQAEIVLAIHEHNRAHSKELLQTFFVPMGVNLEIATANVEPPIEKVTTSLYLEDSVPTRLSDMVLAGTINFRDLNSEIIQVTPDGKNLVIDLDKGLEITETGIVNAIAIRMTTRCGYDEDTFINPNQSYSLGNDRYAPIEGAFDVEEGDKVIVRMNYLAGISPDRIERSVTKE